MALRGRNRRSELRSEAVESTVGGSSNGGMAETPFLSLVVPLFVVCTAVKVLLVLPTYRSTDFDVHRNWLAVTRRLPVREWYFNDANGTTVHTLDYPPNFAYFEWALSHSPLLGFFFPPGQADDRCLELLPDNDNSPSENCVAYQRFTVIFSDLLLWIGAAVACKGAALDASLSTTADATTAFLLIVLNPGLIWLDHIHFQYNGMLLGMLLLSLGLLMHGNRVPADSRLYHLYHLSGAVVYATLLNFKHLYLPLAPLYFFYLLGKYCTVPPTMQIKIDRLAVLAAVTIIALVLPWVPFLVHGPKQQLLQILDRLFPFGRGLVHDYWAANVWALYMLADKFVRIASRKNLLPVPDQLPDVPPVLCAALLLLSLLPPMVIAFRNHSNRNLLQATVYSSFCAFMLAYHVHEKAIMTALLPLTLLTGRSTTANSLFWQASLWGLLGLFPLLFEPYELSFKLTSFVAYMTLCTIKLDVSTVGRMFQFLSACIASTVIVNYEFLPIRNGLEFLPLMITSIACAIPLLGCWAVALKLLVTEHNMSER